MPPPQATYLARTSNTGYDPATLSDDEDEAASSDAASISSSAWSTTAPPSGVTTLAVLDGPIPSGDENATELRDWKISRVGGEPSFPLTSPPPIESRLCLTCSTPMPLVIQLYCPLPHSTLERVIYLFICPRPSCQKRREGRSAGEGPGCVRAWRANGLWREGEEAKVREREEREKREREEKERAERKEAASKIQLGGLVFGGGGGGSSVLGQSSGTAFNPFAAPSAPSNGGTFNPFAVPAPAAAASTPAANPFAPAPSTSATSDAAPNPFALPESSAAAAPATPAVEISTTAEEPQGDEQTISTWPPVASTSSATPVFAPQYVATLYEPSSSSSSSSKNSKGKSREAELARQFEAELAIRNSSSSEESTRLAAIEDDDEGGEEDMNDRARPGKGAGGRVKKGAERASASNKKGASGGPSSAAGGGGDWAGEGYEVQRVKGVDDVFLRFQERVSREGRQIVRYDYGAAPLPYSSSSAAYKLLHPPVATNSDVGTYAPSRLPPCRYCRSSSTFELQLMPHLGLGLDERYEWASVWILSCEAECEGGVAMEGAEEGEAWREERVLVEWEDEGA
ncbi:hypothetical protein JCM10908_006591 [Rhodotorula pacifica]|uniref:programmed cell death 2 domain-containing protein n=1 Tax=Rhodotorula pacifica TaxID=1495444 RepID=UPI003181C880